ncbi:hypothetical protein ACFX2K_016099 [Malus domestica]
MRPARTEQGHSYNWGSLHRHVFDQLQCVIQTTSTTQEVNHTTTVFRPRNNAKILAHAIELPRSFINHSRMAAGIEDKDKSYTIRHQPHSLHPIKNLRGFFTTTVHSITRHN